MNDPKKDGRTESILAETAALFIERESNAQSLITVTSVSLKNRGAEALIRVSVLPDDAADAALSFLKRKRGVFRQLIKETTRLHRIPFVDFELDIGEKNRQRVDELTRNDSQKQP
jgi:ribosome-binding factor A